MAANSISLSPEAQALLDTLQAAPEHVMRAIAAALNLENTYTVSHIQERYLSFASDSRPNPVGLRVQTNRYRQSLHASPAQVNGQQVQSSIGSNVKNRGVSYPAVHEFGATIPPHTITAKGKALAFHIGERLVFAKSVKHPGAVCSARQRILHGIQDRLADYGEALSEAVIRALTPPATA